MRNFYYVDTGGSVAGSGSQSDPITVNGLDSLTVVPGDTILFQGGQQHIVGVLQAITGWTGSAELPITCGSYGNGRAWIEGTGSHNMFNPNQSDNLRFVGLDFSSSQTGVSIFHNTGPVGTIDFINCHVISGGSFWYNTSTGATGTVRMYDSTLEYLWRYGFRQDSINVECSKLTAKYIGVDRNGNYAWGEDNGNVFALTGAGTARVADSEFYRNKSIYVGKGSGQSWFSRVIAENYPTTGINYVNSYMFAEFGGGLVLNNSIIRATGSQVMYPLLCSNNSGKMYALSLGLYVNNDNANTINVLSATAGDMVYQNNYMNQATSGPSPIAVIGLMALTNNRYDFDDTGVYLKFNLSQNWFDFQTNYEGFSSVGPAGLGPNWYTKPDYVMPTGCVLINSGAIYTGFDTTFMTAIDGAWRGSDPWTGIGISSYDIGPFAHNDSKLTQYSDGGYNRYGFAPA